MSELKPIEEINLSGPLVRKTRWGKWELKKGDGLEPALWEQKFNRCGYCGDSTHYFWGCPFLSLECAQCGWREEGLDIGDTCLCGGVFIQRPDMPAKPSTFVNC